MNALDLFCGLGGWSDGLALEGFDVLGVEIEPEIAERYEHDCIIADVQSLDPSRFKGFDLIVGSPPCRNFTRLPDKAMRNGKLWQWKIPKNPDQGMILVDTFLNFVEIAEPKYWLLENVSGLSNYLDVKPRCKPYLGKSMLRYFWGNFPSFLIPKSLDKKKIWDIEGKYRSWERARIPLPVARALGKAIKDDDEE